MKTIDLLASRGEPGWAESCRPLGELRLFKQARWEGDIDPPPVLQQAWSVLKSEDWIEYVEWRDVPIVEIDG